MTIHLRASLVFLLLGAVASPACLDTTQPGPETGFEIAVAPMTLPGIDDVCYTLEVRNDAGETVWLEEHVCSSQYGDSVGDISYIGTCDAQDTVTTDAGVAMNTVTLTIEHLYTDDVDPDDYTANAVVSAEWVNPCGLDADSVDVEAVGDGFGPCQITAPCEENQDTPIAFNVTVMRDANQGFFDVAVNFEDIFCSAKLDCRDSGTGDYLQLLHNGSERDDTVVLALACTAGAGQATHLYWTDITLTCGGTDYLVDPSGGPGNLNPAGVPALFQAATYRGAEQLTDGAASLNKLYWNIALGLTATGRTCTVSANATAHDGALVGGVTPASTTYPYIEFGADLGSCTQHALGSAQVAESYTGLTSTETFTTFYDGTDVGPTVSTPDEPVLELPHDVLLADFRGQVEFRGYYRGGMVVQAAMPDTGLELWLTDGTYAVLMTDIQPGAGWSNPTACAEIGDVCVFFAALFDDGEGTSDYRLFAHQLDGTNVMVEGENGPTGRGRDPVAFNGEAFFIRDAQLFKTDGTSVTLLQSATEGPDNPSRYLYAAEDGVYFVASSASHGTELWKTDGTVTEIAFEFTPGATGTDLYFQMASMSGEIYFRKDGSELWRVVPGGDPVLVRDLGFDFLIFRMVLLGDSFYLSYNYDDVWQLKSDGSEPPSLLVAGYDNAIPLFGVGSTLYVADKQGSVGTELYTVDVSAPSPSLELYMDISAGTRSSYPYGGYPLGDEIFFIADPDGWTHFYSVPNP